MIQVGQTINHKLDFDTSGKIKLVEKLDSAKDGIDLYLTVYKNEVPFSDFGNQVIHEIFKSNDSDEIESFTVDLIRDIIENFDINITDYTVTINDDKIKLQLFLEYLEIIETTISVT